MIEKVPPLFFWRCVNFGFENACKLVKEKGEFTSDDLMAITVADFHDPSKNYHAQNNFYYALSLFSSLRLISCTVKPRFVGQVALDQNFYKMTLWGRGFRKLPYFVRVMSFYIGHKWRRILSILGALATVPLVINAYKGVETLVGWWDSAASVIIAAIVYLIIMRLISK